MLKTPVFFLSSLASIIIIGVSAPTEFCSLDIHFFCYHSTYIHMYRNRNQNLVEVIGSGGGSYWIEMIRFRRLRSATLLSSLHIWWGGGWSGPDKYFNEVVQRFVNYGYRKQCCGTGTA
jgi:hypothetical protein